MNSAPVRSASAPSSATASRRAAEYRGCASPLSQCRVMPSCQSAVCRNRIVAALLSGDRARCRGKPSVGPPSDKTGDSTGLCPAGPACSSVDRVSDPFRTLVLLRHGKSAYPPDCADRDRPLAERGIREAGLAGDWLRAHVPPVDAVLCSPATRTRQTFDRTRLTAPVHYAERLYDATPGTVIDVINGVAAHFDTDIRTLLVIGHEP